VPGRFKLNSALLEEFNVENVLIVGGGQEIYEKHGEWLEFRKSKQCIFNLSNSVV
jgi:hypothetical protein